jgi:sensor histidine kinase regulating citrate/malate metabolism
MVGMSLRAKLVFFIIGTVAFVQMAWGLNVVRSNAELMERESNRRGRAILQAIAAPAAVRLANREIETLDAILATYIQRTSGDLTFQAIAILDMDGTVVSHTDPRRFGQKATDAFTRRALLSARPLLEIQREKEGRMSRMSMPTSPVCAGERSRPSSRSRGSTNGWKTTSWWCWCPPRSSPSPPPCSSDC